MIGGVKYTLIGRDELARLRAGLLLGRHDPANVVPVPGVGFHINFEFKGELRAFELADIGCHLELLPPEGPYEV